MATISGRRSREGCHLIVYPITLRVLKCLDIPGQLVHVAVSILVVDANSRLAKSEGRLVKAETGEIAVGGNRGRSRDCSHIFMRPTTKRRERELPDVVARGPVDVRAIAQSATGQALVAQRIKRRYKCSRALREVSLHPPPPHPGQLAYVHTEGRRDGREVDARVVTTYPEACFR